MTKRFLLCFILMISGSTLYFVTRDASRAPPPAADAHTTITSSPTPSGSVRIAEPSYSGTPVVIGGSVTQPVSGGGGVLTVQGVGTAGATEPCRRYNANRSSWCNACAFDDCVPPAAAPPAPPKRMRIEWDQRDAIIFETIDAYHAWSGWSDNRNKCVSTERDTWTCYPHGGRLVEVEDPKRKAHERDSLARVWLGPNEEMCMRAWREGVEYCARNDTKVSAYFDLKVRAP